MKIAIQCILHLYLIASVLAKQSARIEAPSVALSSAMILRLNAICPCISCSASPHRSSLMSRDKGQ